ncbi:MAG: SDR family NAD(P)-dependent oxidoreductase [Candidatus Dormibacteria bacterium]
MKLDGRVALVTGGAGGVGSIIAGALAAEGAALMLLGRSEDRLRVYAATLGATHRDVRWVQADVEDPEAMEAAVTTTVATHGRLDILVNCAGRYGPFGPVHLVDPGAWAATIRTNLVGTFNAIRAAVPAMIEGGRGGTIINLSGGGSSKGRPTFSAYASSKIGVVRLTETVAEELRPYGITVNALAPGGVYTEMTDELLRSPGLAAPGDIAEAERIRATGGTPPERIGALAVFLASDAGHPLTGRFISAPWDDWEAMARRATEEDGLGDLYTLRRVTPPEPGAGA